LKKLRRFKPFFHDKNQENSPRFARSRARNLTEVKA
jgi:hypothetical protein